VEEEIDHLKDFSANLIDRIKEEKEKPKQTVREATAKINKFQEQITKHFEQQSAENDKFQKEIAELSGDKTSIEQALIGM
jgi:seryl-tRNA synthetase